MQSWVASNPVSRLLTYPTPFSLNGVSLLMASAFGYALQTPYSAPIRSPFVDTYQWKLTVLPITVSLCFSMSKHYFYPYQGYQVYKLYKVTSKEQSRKEASLGVNLLGTEPWSLEKHHMLSWGMGLCYMGHQWWPWHLLGGCSFPCVVWKLHQVYEGSQIGR